MKKITAYFWAFIVAIVIFFTTGICTLGSTKTAGDSMTVVASKSVYYDLGSSIAIKAIYVNIGGIHNEVGEDATITVKRTTSTSTVTSASWNTFGTAISVGNVNSAENKSGALYNWIPVAVDQDVNARRLSFTSSVNLELCEIAVVKKTGGMAVLTPYIPGSNYTMEEVEKTLDSQAVFAEYVDEKGVVTLENGANVNFTQEEGYYMGAVQNILSGNAKYEDAKYLLDGNFNYLATLLMTPSVALFGTSPFALRLPAFIATCVLIIYAFFLMKELTKRNEYAFWFAFVLMIGGLATTVGRLGAPYALVASALVASAYYMYRFFSRGIHSKAVFKGGMNILYSGIFAAFAMAMDSTAIFPVIAILVLFGFGMRRQKLAYKVALEKVADKGEERTNEAGETVVVNPAAAKEKSLYETKNRIAYGLAALSFVMGTVVLLLFAGILSYSAYVRANGTSVNFLALIWDGFAGSFRDNGVTSFASANKAVILSWLLPFKAATLYTGVSAAAKGTYLAWNVLPNIVLCIAALASFIAVTVKVILDYVHKNTNKENLRIRRIYFVLLGGMVSALVAGLVRGNFSAITGLFFQVSYFGFLPLIVMIMPKKWFTVAAISAVLVLSVAVFAVTVPSMYGFTVMASYAKYFGWMSFLSNGFFRI